MTTRIKINCLILALIPISMEFWQFWKPENRNVNWWLALDYPLQIQWYFKDMGTEIMKLLFAIYCYRSSYMYPLLRRIARGLLWIMIIGVVGFFVCYNRFNHLIIYSTFFGVLVYDLFKTDVVKFSASVKRTVSSRFRRKNKLHKPPLLHRKHFEELNIEA